MGRRVGARAGGGAALAIGGAGAIIVLARVVSVTAWALYVDATAATLAPRAHALTGALSGVYCCTNSSSQRPFDSCVGVELHVNRAESGRPICTCRAAGSDRALCQHRSLCRKKPIWKPIWISAHSKRVSATFIHLVDTDYTEFYTCRGSVSGDGAMQATTCCARVPARSGQI